MGNQFKAELSPDAKCLLASGGSFAPLPSVFFSAFSL